LLSKDLLKELSKNKKDSHATLKSKTSKSRRDPALTSTYKEVKVRAC
jgi:hypothetical protein